MRARRAAAALLGLLLGVCLAPAASHAQPAIGQALRARDWAAADMLARQSADPLAGKLVRYQRLLAPGQAAAQEIGDFAAANPTWPQQALLRRRLAEAATAIADDEAARVICEAYLPASDTALLRCARAARAGGHMAQAATLARQAWVAGLANAGAQAAFLREWPGALDPETEWRRFDALAWANDPQAEWQAARVDAARSPLALARVALRRNDIRAADLLAGVPPALAHDPVLLLEQARWLRGRDDNAAALAVWRGAATAEAAAPPERRPAFWAERERLARALLVAGDTAGNAAGAYFLADDTQAAHDQVVEADFLAGWIALRKLHDPVRATAHFQAMQAASPAIITQGRAYYWLARAAAASAAAAQADYARAAQFPTSWYGQQAAAKLDGSATPRIAALRDPAPVPGAAEQFDAAELEHAATMLAGWGDAPTARLFLLRQALNAPDASTAVLTARRASALGMPDVAVQVARRAGKAGVAMPHLGWPAPFQPPPGVDAPLALGLMRQESSFDPGIVSGAGAIGLMQLMPATARQVDGGLTDPAAALAEPATNMRLGVAYLQSLLTQFHGVRPYALAAYNAGPHRVREWITANGDAAASGDADAMIDWIEEIPFTETRNYVQRVLEGAAIYQANPPPKAAQ